MTALLARWTDKLAGEQQAGTSDSPPLARVMEVGRQQHLRCTSIHLAQYTDTWTCHLHKESRLTTHTDITPPHPSRPLSKPPTHSPQLLHPHHRKPNPDTRPTRCLIHYTIGHRGQLHYHLPIITIINMRHDYRLQQNRQTFTHYKMADWTQFTEDTEFAFAQTTIPTNIHTANRI